MKLLVADLGLENLTLKKARTRAAEPEAVRTDEAGEEAGRDRTGATFAGSEEKDVGRTGPGAFDLMSLAEVVSGRGRSRTGGPAAAAGNGVESDEAGRRKRHLGSGVARAGLQLARSVVLVEQHSLRPVAGLGWPDRWGTKDRACLFTWARKTPVSSLFP